MVDLQIKSQWTQTIYFSTQEGVDISGAPIRGTPQLLQGVKVERSSRYTSLSSSELRQEKKETHIILSSKKIPLNAKIWLVEDDQTRQDQGRSLKWIDTFYNEYGQVSHYEMGV